MPLGEFLSEGPGCSILAYGGDSKPEEHGGERQEAIEPLPPRSLLPLDVACSDKESNEDTYATDPALACEP